MAMALTKHLTLWMIHVCFFIIFGWGSLFLWNSWFLSSDVLTMFLIKLFVFLYCEFEPQCSYLSRILLRHFNFPWPFYSFFLWMINRYTILYSCFVVYKLLFNILPSRHEIKVLVKIIQKFKSMFLGIMKSWGSGCSYGILKIWPF